MYTQLLGELGDGDLHMPQELHEDANDEMPMARDKWESAIMHCDAEIYNGEYIILCS